MRVVLHIDFNSYFATVEQQANPKLRGKPIGVTGGDRMERTVLGAASVEAKRFGVKTGMTVWEAKRLCPEMILVKGDSDKYLSVTTRFINILKDYSPALEIFSIDECFLELSETQDQAITIAQKIKQRIKSEVGEWITCSVGISYNKLMAKLAGSLYKQSLRINLSPELERFILKPDGLVMIADEEAAKWVLDRADLDDICGIGGRIKHRLFSMGVRDFKTLRRIPKELLLASFKSYGENLFNMARGIDHSPVLPFYERAEVKSIGHRYTIYHDTADTDEIRQVLLKICEMIAARLRTKKLVGKTVHCWFRYAGSTDLGGIFSGDGMQATINSTDDGLEVFRKTWKIFRQMWNGERIRMIGASVSNLRSAKPANLPLFFEDQRTEIIFQAVDKVNNKFGDFTLQRAALLKSSPMQRKPNPFLSDRRFRIK